MKVKQTIISFIFLLVFGSFFLNTDIASADCFGIKTSIINCPQGQNSNNLKDNGVWYVLVLAVNILSAGVGIAAVGGIVFGSILYTSSGGNPEKTKKAITMLFDILLGIVAWGLMWALLNYLIPGGIFT